MRESPQALTFSIGNECLERTFAVRNGKFRSEAVVNRDTGARLEMDSQEFRILFLDGRGLTGLDFAYRGHQAHEAPDGTRVLTVELELAAMQLQAKLVYRLGPDDFFVRKQLTLSAATPPDSPVDRLDVETFSTDTPVDAALEHQPLFAGDQFFLGLEYPGGVNVVQSRQVRLSHFPGTGLATQPLVSKSAVIGVAVSGAVMTDFLAYVERIRRKTAPYVMWNSGGLLQIYDPVQLRKESMCLTEVLTQAIETLQTEFTAKRQTAVHAYVLEPSWHDRNTLYTIDRGKFTAGLQPLADRLRQTGSHLGLWLSPTTPIASALLTRKAMEDNGYAVAVNAKRGAHYPCLSSQPYFEAIKAVMRRHARELALGYYKMDFSYFDCEGQGHGHLPNRRHGREANINAMIEIMRTLAAENPDLRLVPTSGMWLSPWWLLYADVIWPHGMMDFNYSRGPVSVNPRHWELTLRDQEFHRLLRQERGRFPFSGMLYMGMAAGPRYNIAGPLETRESYLTSVIYCMARQIGCPERYIDAPPSGLEEDWDATAQAVRWSLDRHGRVPDGKVFGGEPARGQVYGFSNLGPAGGVVTLRNPDMRSQQVDLPSAELEAETEFVAEQVFPERCVLALGSRDDLERCRFELEPHAVAVIEIFPRARLQRPLPTGCRYSLVEESPGHVVYDVFSEPGVELRFELLHPTPVRSCTVAESAVDPVGVISVPSCGVREHLSLRRLPDTPAGKGGSATKTYRLDVPDTHAATARVMTDDEQLHALKFSVNMGGFFGGLPFKACQGTGWTAYDVELNPRDMNVVRWGFPAGDAPLNAKLWLLRRWERQRTRVRVTFDPVPAPRLSPELPTPFAGVVRDAVCVSEVAPEPADELRPWTDEYAEQADGGG